MKRLLIVSCSDQVNRYGSRLALTGLSRSVADGWRTGSPTSMGHDVHKPVAWSRPLALHLQPGLARVVAITLVPESDPEREELGQVHQEYLAATIQRAVKPFRARLNAELSPFWSGGQHYFGMNFAGVHDPGLAWRVSPELLGAQDKDGLVPLSFLKPVSPGVYQVKDLILFAHPFFRRSLSRWNSLNSEFLSRLHDLQGSGADMRIAIDPDLVGIADSYRQEIEFQYWWGPKFDDHLGNIAPGVTVHAETERRRIFNGIHSTEFWWYVQDGRRTFECEEIREYPTFQSKTESFGCRFIHSIIDPTGGLPVHLDGAVRAYDSDAMLQRFETDISRSGRSAEYTKLWRIDGKIPVPVWKELLTHYFRDNSLVGEYLGGEDEGERTPPEIVASTRDPIHRFLPCYMEPGSGVRIALSYRDPGAEGTWVVAHDVLHRKEDTLTYVESDTIELLKALRKQGVEVHVPPECPRVGYEDPVLNLPLVVHNGPEAPRFVRVFLESINSLCEVCQRRDSKTLISFAFGVPSPDAIRCVSVAGHVQDILSWLASGPARVLPEVSDIDAWTEKLHLDLISLFPHAKDGVELQSIQMTSGLLAFPRQFLPVDMFELRREEAGQALMCELSLERLDAALVELIGSGRIAPSIATKFLETRCSRCKGNYEVCTCSKYLEEGVSQVIERCEFLGVVWAPRRADDPPMEFRHSPTASVTPGVR